MTERTGMPHDHKLETKVLAVALHMAEHRQLLVDELLPTDFYATGTCQVFQAITHLMRQAGESFDLLTLASAAQDYPHVAGFLEDAHEIQLMQIEQYEGALERLRQLGEARALARACLDVGAWGLDASTTADPEDFMQRASERLTAALGGRRQKLAGQTIGQAAAGYMATLAENKPVTPRVVAPTGIPSVDKALPWRGFASGELAVIVARPGMGKTSFGLQVARDNAIAGMHTALFSYEMSAEDVSLSVVAQDAQIPVRNFASRMSAENIAIALQRYAQLSAVPLYIYDCAGLVYEDLANACRAKKRKGQLDLVVIDYLQLMRMRKRYQSRFEEIGDIATALKLLSRELDIPIVALAQLNREVEKRADKRPLMS